MRCAREHCCSIMPKVDGLCFALERFVCTEVLQILSNLLAHNCTSTHLWLVLCLCPVTMCGGNFPRTIVWYP